MAQYIVNMGGYDGSFVNTVDVFKVTANGVEAVADHGLSLSTARRELSAAACGNYILAMGGIGDGNSFVNTVDVFKVTENGVEAVADHGLSLSTAWAYLAAASCGNYILAMGGNDSNGFVNTVDVFKVTANGVEAVADHGLSLSTGRNRLAVASAGNYILAMGGHDGNDYSNTVDVFHVTENGVEHIADHGLSLSTARNNLAAASAGNYILAMGGYDRSFLNTVDVFKVTANGVEAVADHGLSLSTARNKLAAASAGNYILAMGGHNGSDYLNTVDVFKVTANGVEHIADHGLSLSTARRELSAAACGNYILAMGGVSGSDYFNTVDVFQIFN